MQSRLSLGIILTSWCVLAGAPPAMASTAPAQDSELIVSVWRAFDGSLMPETMVSAGSTQETLRKAELIPPGIHRVLVPGSKAYLEVEHPDMPGALFEVNLPAAVVLIDVIFQENGDIDCRMRGTGGATDQYSFNLPRGGPANDLCENAIGPLNIPSLTFGTTTGAGTDSEFPFCGTGITSPGVWYFVVGTGTTITASTCTDFFDYDTKISVYCRGCDEPLCVGGNDDSCPDGGSGLLSTVTFCSQAGQEYLILVHGFGGASGDFELTLDEDGADCNPTVFCVQTGACCLNGECIDGVTEGDCDAAGGEYQGDGTICAGGGYELEECANDFEDISATGNGGPTGDDDGFEVPIGFSFEFFGVAHTDIGISTNGYLGFDGNYFDFSNDPCPSMNTPNDAIFPLWDDFNPQDGGMVQYETRGSAGDRRFIAQWTAVPEFGTGGVDTATFQAVLFEADHSIEFRYGALNGVPSFGDDATIGVEDSSGTIANCVPDSDIAEGLCLRFTLGDPLDCGPACVTLDFETEDDFSTPLGNGQDISTPPEFGNLVSISSSGNNLGAAIFDSTVGGPNDGGEDPDLLVDLGNILIVQDNENPDQSNEGFFDVPDDSFLGGTLHFDFVGPVEAQSVDLIDICPGFQDALVTLIDANQLSRTYLVPAGWTGDVEHHGPPGFGTLDLTTLADQEGFEATATATQDDDFDPTLVTRIEVFFTSSGGLDNLSFCPSASN